LDAPSVAIQKDATELITYQASLTKVMTKVIRMSHQPVQLFYHGMWCVLKYKDHLKTTELNHCIHHAQCTALQTIRCKYYSIIHHHSSHTSI